MPIADRKLSFEKWMLVVDELIQRRVGLRSADLDDYGYRDMYDQGVTALSAARRTIRATQEACGME